MNDRPPRLILGDCLVEMARIDDASVDAVIADPPYLLGAASARKSADKVVGWADINNASFWYSEWMGRAWRLLKPSGCLWIFANWRSLPVLQCAASKIPGMSLLSVLVWDKQWPGVGSMRGLRQNYEIVVLMGKPEFCIVNRALGDIWQCKWTSQRPSGHPQEKPVPLVERMLDESGVPAGGLVLDPFMGSGTTGEACLNTGRDFIGIELDSGSFAIASRRLVEAVVSTPLFDEKIPKYSPQPLMAQ